MTPQQEYPRPPRGIEHLQAREDLEKSQYAYDSVQQRVEQYQKRLASLYAALRENAQTEDERTDLIVGEIAHSSRLQQILPEGYGPNDRISGQYAPQRLNRYATLMPTYAADVAERHNRATVTRDWAEVAYIENTAEREMRIFFNVQLLEEEYGYIENIVAGLEQQVRGRGPEALPQTLQDQMLERRMAVLNAQIDATEDPNRLQTIQIALYREPMTGRTSPAYHLLRLPANASLTFVDPRTGQDALLNGVGQIPLSGEAQYVRFQDGVTTDIIRRNLQARVNDRSAAIRMIGGNNLIFDFVPVQQPEPEPDPAPPRERPEPIPPVEARPPFEPIIPPAERPSSPEPPPAVPEFRQSLPEDERFEFQYAIPKEDVEKKINAERAQVDVPADRPSQTQTETTDAGGQARHKTWRDVWNHYRNGSQNDNQNK